MKLPIHVLLQGRGLQQQFVPARGTVGRDAGRLVLGQHAAALIQRHGVLNVGVGLQGVQDFLGAVAIAKGQGSAHVFAGHGRHLAQSAQRGLLLGHKGGVQRHARGDEQPYPQAGTQ